MSNLPSNYFKQENLLLTIFIVSGLFGIIPLIGLNVEAMNQFVPVWIMRDQSENIWNFFTYCMYIHLFEAFLAFILAGLYHGMNLKTTFKWTLSTFVHGMFSLRHLTRS